jgi:DNA end-binding protein Ku
VLETMYLAEDVYSQAEIDEAMEETDVKKAELELARQIVEGLAAEFDPGRADERLPAATFGRSWRPKMRGEEITEPEPGAEPAPAVDLIEALKASVAAAKGSSARPKKAAAKPAAAKRPATQGRQEVALHTTRGLVRPLVSCRERARLVGGPRSRRRRPGAGLGTGACRSCPGRSGRPQRHRA